MIFDPYPRPSHPDGAAFVLNRSLAATASHLGDLLAIDARLIADRHMPSKAQLLGQYSAHIFALRLDVEDRTPTGLAQDALLASLPTLETRAQIANLKNQNALLQAQLDRLSSETVPELRREITELKLQHFRLLSETKAFRSQAAGVDELRKEVRDLHLAMEHRSGSSNLGSSTMNGGVAGPSYANPKTRTISSSPSPVNTDRLFRYSAHTSAHVPSGSPKPRANGLAALQALMQPAKLGAADVRPPDGPPSPGSYNSDFSQTQRALSINDGVQALRLQRQFDDEDRRLRAEREQLSELKPPVERLV
jgi:hypothetical protein